MFQWYVESFKAKNTLKEIKTGLGFPFQNSIYSEILTLHSQQGALWDWTMAQCLCSERWYNSECSVILDLWIPKPSVSHAVCVYLFSVLCCLYIIKKIKKGQKDLIMNSDTKRRIHWTLSHIPKCILSILGPKNFVSGVLDLQSFVDFQNNKESKSGNICAILLHYQHHYQWKCTHPCKLRVIFIFHLFFFCFCNL